MKKTSQFHNFVVDSAARSVSLLRLSVETRLVRLVVNNEAGQTLQISLLEVFDQGTQVARVLCHDNCTDIALYPL